MSRVKVRALVAGVRGYDANDNAIEIPAGVSRWMDHDDAIEAAQAGKVQLVAGISTRDLKAPENPRPPIKRYKRRDLTAET